MDAIKHPTSQGVDTMANVKDIYANGVLPFNIGDSEEVNKFLGHLNRPSSDLRIVYIGIVESRPNLHGGTTTYYRFILSGVDGGSHDYYMALASAFIANGAEFDEFVYSDIMNNFTVDLLAECNK